MSDPVHLLKLSAGTESVETLMRWQASARAKGADGLPRHVTRMWPKKEAQILHGGSREDGIRRCAIVLDPELVRVTPAPRRPFQGWRYLAAEDAPPDLSAARIDDDDLPPDLAGALADIGVL